MILKSLTLQNYRNYAKASFTFSPQTTIVIGLNAAGKSNLIEALFLLATGKSNRSEKEKQLIQFGKQVARIKGEIIASGSAATGPARSFPPIGARPIIELRAVGSPSTSATRRLPDEENEILEAVFADQGTSLLK